MTPLARVRSYEDLADALAVHRRRIGMPQDAIEQITGMQKVYQYEKKMRFPGHYLRPWLEVLGVELVLVLKEEVLAANLSDLPAEPATYKKVRKKVGAKGGRARHWNLSRARKREIGRMGGLARWRKAQGK